MTRNPLVIVGLTAIVATATLVFAFALSPASLANAPPFLPAIWICLAVEIFTGLSLAALSSKSWASAPAIVRAAIAPVLLAWTVLSAALVLATPSLGMRSLYGIQFGAFVVVAVVLGALAMGSGHVANNEATLARGADTSAALRSLSRSVVALLDQRPGLPAHAVARCRRAAEQIRSAGESGLRAEVGREAIEIMRELETLLVTDAVDAQGLDQRAVRLERLRTLP